MNELNLLSKYLLIPFKPYDEIIPNLWLGNLRCCLDEQFLKDKNIKAVVSLYIPFINKDYFLSKNIAIYQIKISDNISLKSNIILYHEFNNIHKFIKSYLNRNYGVLVHCHYGWQRSATTCTAYLMKEYGLSYNKAVDHIKSKRKLALFPNSSFELALKLYNKKLYNKKLI